MNSLPGRLPSALKEDKTCLPSLPSREHLESIWINLLMNSIDAIGDETGTIEINTFYDEGNFYVTFP